MQTTNNIEAVIKALGTMVMIPQYESDPNNIAAKPVFTGMLQQPIIPIGPDRAKVENKLLQLIENLH